jgi:PAS domain-containing protein
MLDSHLRSRKALLPGMRALQASGDGFWELDLVEGSAWFSDWVYNKLQWPSDAQRTTLYRLQPMLRPDTWETLLRRIRGHLEQRTTLDSELCVQLGDGHCEWWQLRGTAQRNDSGQPIYLAGSVRDISADRHDRLALSESLILLRGAFEVLPVAAALLDDRGDILEINRRWRERPELDIAGALPRLHAALAGTDTELAWEYEAPCAGGTRRLHLRALALRHPGASGWVVTVAD